MVATTLDGNGDIPVGIPVVTADGQRLGYVVDGDAYQIEVGDGFLFMSVYTVVLSEVDRYEGGRLILKLTMEQVEEQHLDGQGWT